MLVVDPAFNFSTKGAFCLKGLKQELIPVHMMTVKDKN